MRLCRFARRGWDRGRGGFGRRAFVGLRVLLVCFRTRLGGLRPASCRLTVGLLRLRRWLNLMLLRLHVLNFVFLCCRRRLNLALLRLRGGCFALGRLVALFRRHYRLRRCRLRGFIRGPALLDAAAWLCALGRRLAMADRSAP